MLPLVSDRDYFYIYPISIWIPTGEATREDVSIPLDALAIKHGFKLVVDPVTVLEAKEKKVTLESGRILEDYALYCCGIGTRQVIGTRVWSIRFLFAENLKKQLRFMKRWMRLIRKGYGKIAMGFGGNPKDTSAVRGGPAFEVLFNVDTYLKKKGVRDHFELTFFAPMEKPGQKMGDKALVLMEKMFKHANIHKKVGSKITAFVEDGIVFEDGTKVDSDLTMFISAGTGHSVTADSGLPLSEAGFVVTNEYNEDRRF